MSSKSYTGTRRALLALFVLLTAIPLAGAQQGRGPQVSAQLSSGVVKLGGNARLHLSVEGADRANIEALPTIEGAELGRFQGPSVEQSIQIVGSRRTFTKRMRWVAPLRPTAPGEVQIPPITLRVDGVRMQTRPLTLKVVEDLRGEELGFIEAVGVPEKLYEGMPFTLEMKFGFDASLRVNSAGLFLPWWGNLLGTLTLEEDSKPFGARSIELALNGREAVTVEETAREEVDGRPFRVFWLRRNLLPTRPGTLEFPTSYFEFQQLLKRGSRVGFFDRTPDETESFYVSQPAFEVEVLALPEEGRPFDFSGAVGNFVADAEVDRRDVDAGDSIKLSIDYSGSGNLDYFEVPDLARMEAFDDFRVYGVTERKRFGARRVTYDIAPISSKATEIPSVPLRVFDPEREAYVTVSTDPIPIKVRDLEGSGLLAENGGSRLGLDIRDLHTEAPGSRLPRPGGWAPLAGMGSVPLLWLLMRTWVRRKGDPDAPHLRRYRGARKQLARDLRRAKTAEQEGGALCRFLAARTGERDQAWVGRDVEAFCRDFELELEGDALEGLTQLSRELDQRTWAGGNEPVGRDRVLGVADALLQGGL